jgi:hypothetical protein
MQVLGVVKDTNEDEAALERLTLLCDTFYPSNA